MYVAVPNHLHKDYTVRAARAGVGPLASTSPDCSVPFTNSSTSSPFAVTLWGEDAIEEELCGLRFRVRPNAFLQTNTGMAERLYEVVAEFAGLSGSERVFDLYCGIGTIGLTMAKRAGEVWGLEIVPEAIADALEGIPDGFDRFVGTPPSGVSSAIFIGKMLAKAASLPADMVFIDLEDAVLPAAKDEARVAVVDGDALDRARGPRRHAVEQAHRPALRDQRGDAGGPENVAVEGCVLAGLRERRHDIGEGTERPCPEAQDAAGKAFRRETAPRAGSFLPWDTAQSAFLDGSRALAGSAHARRLRAGRLHGRPRVRVRGLRARRARGGHGPRGGAADRSAARVRDGLGHRLLHHLVGAGGGGRRSSAGRDCSAGCWRPTRPAATAA